MRDVDTVNKFFEVDRLPYHLTNYVFSPVDSDRGWGSYKLVRFPQVICRENEVLHVMAIEPTLTLLSGPEFEQANEEFLNALDDFRKEDYEDCVVKCGSSFESVMKIICDRKGWTYSGEGEATKLLNTILQERTSIVSIRSSSSWSLS